MAREYQISKLTGRCAACGKELATGEEFVAAVREGPAELLREDFCPPCWDAKPRDQGPQVLAEWRARVPEKEEKKRKLFVNDDILIQFFHRLENSPDAGRVCFRFVLALVLMRKKLLVYDRLDKREDGGEVWTMHFRRDQAAVSVIDPHMDAEAIAKASQQLGEILEGQL